jgi:hypothetical protein
VTIELTRLLELWRASTFRDFTGARLELRVPLNEAVLNEVLERIVLPSARQLRSLTATIHPANVVELRVASSLSRWLPVLTVPLEIHPALVFTPTPILHIDIRRGSLVSELSPLAALWSSRLPRGVRLLDRRLEIHLAELVPQGDAQLPLAWLREGHISTNEGVIWLSLSLSVS